MTGTIFYTVAAILLYLLSDWILNQIEIKRGKRFENRSLIFFAIILVLALSSFSLIERMSESRTGDQSHTVIKDAGG
jgi:hypothetical protein